MLRRRRKGEEEDFIYYHPGLVVLVVVVFWMGMNGMEEETQSGQKRETGAYKKSE